MELGLYVEGNSSVIVYKSSLLALINRLLRRLGILVKIAIRELRHIRKGTVNY